MRHLVAVQTIASLIVLSIIAMAEVAARLLARFPDSVFLWYVNQDVFRFIENARHSLALPGCVLINQTTLYWDLGLVLVVLLMYRVRWRFGVALMSHTCLGFVGLLTYEWAMNLPRSVSLKPVVAAFDNGNGSVLLLATGLAMLSAILAHLTYLAAIRSHWLGPISDQRAHSPRTCGDSDLRDLR